MILIVMIIIAMKNMRVKIDEENDGDYGIGFSWFQLALVLLSA